MVSDLIFDVGANNGDDAAYYLRSGYRVVGVEADPTYIEYVRGRFEPEIEQGRLTLVHAAIGSNQGTALFHVSEGNRGVYSSLDADMASRGALPTRRIEVRCVRLRTLFEEFGTPYYLKTDIEGADHYCLADIDPADPPEYVSFEASYGRLCDLFTLHSKGYTQFKLINQGDHFRKMDPPALHSAQLANAIYRHECREFAKRWHMLANGYRWLRRVWQGSRRRVGFNPPRAATGDRRYDFRVSSSGPMCEETDGTWEGIESTAYAWLYYVWPSGWFDVHAKR